MNREIKFRIWDKQNKIFIYERDASHKRLAISLVGLVYHGGYDDVLSENDYVVQQYTGLKDKNNVEIYEGDIIENETSYQEYCSPAVVSMSVYEEVQWAMFIKFQKIETYYEVLKQNFNGVDLYEELPMSYFHQNSYKVIGNIFENPELLK